MLPTLSFSMAHLCGPGRVSALWIPVLGLALAAGEVGAQGVAVVQVEEDFRAAPNGTVLGQLFPGTRLELHEREGDWARVSLRGFVWTASLQVLSDGEFHLTVSEEGGENLREEPSGRVAAWLLRGARLEELERITGWIEVRRTGWVWLPSIEGMAASEASPEEAGDAVPAGREGTDEEESGDPDGSAEVAVDGRAVDGSWLRGGPEGSIIFTAPDGDTLGRVDAGSDLRVLAREGSWARVRLEGWAWVPELEEPAGVRDSPPATDLTPADLSGDPARYLGELVELELQFISLERAEPIRSDFYEGEPFLLARSLGEDRSFVYLPLEADRLAQAEALTPLDHIRIVGRVRTGAAALTGSPVLDLVELEPLR